MRGAALAAALAVAALPASAQLSATSHPGAAGCARTRPVHAGNVQGYSATSGSGQCFISVHPTNSVDLTYRDYAVYESGLLFVFNSYGPGEDIARLTSAREFYFFPRLQVPALEIDAAAATLSVVMADGRRLRFDTVSTHPAALDGGSISAASAYDPALRGGVEIPSHAGLMLDCGYRQGGQPTSRSQRDKDSTFRAPSGQTCTVKNHEVFEYTPDGEHHFKFDDTALKTFLAARCPQIPALW